MRLFRAPIIRSLATLFTGIIFLNMGFFLIEISALKIEKDRQLVENVAKLLAGSSAEEEQDGFSGPDEDSTVNEADWIIAHAGHSHEPTAVLVSGQRVLHDQGVPLFGHQSIFSPPPEA